MRINVSEAYREEFEVFISKYQQFCDRMIDLMVDNVPFEKLKTYCIRYHPDVMSRLADTVSSSDIMRGIVDNTCSITNITPLEDVIQYYYITDRRGMIEGYQRSLDKYLSKLRVRYLLGSSKDIVNAKTIIFILDWTPDDTSFPHIKRLLYEAFYHLDKRIIVQDTGKKILHLLHIYYNYTVTTVPLLHVSCYAWLLQFGSLFPVLHTHAHTHNRVSNSLLLHVV